MAADARNRRAGPMTYDYKCHRTTTLFAAFTPTRTADIVAPFKGVGMTAFGESCRHRGHIRSSQSISLEKQPSLALYG